MSTPSVTPNDPTQNYPASPDQGGPVPQNDNSAPAPQQPQSRLGAILQAVAKVSSTAMQGIPDTGRPGFVQGLGQGARAVQGLKFKSFDDQLRLAQLHNQDVKLQNDTQAQRDAHKRAELDNRSLANSLGIDYDTIPSDGNAVMDHLHAQTAASGAASVPAGTHLSGDGATVNIPKDTQATRDGQKQMYQTLGPVFGLPSLPKGADFVPPQLLNMLTNKLHGFGQDGKTVNHDDLPGAIGALKQQRDTLSKNGASPDQLKAIDNTLGIYQANLDALDKHSTDLKESQKKAELAAGSSPEALKAVRDKKQAELDVTNSPANQAAAAQGAGKKTSAETEAKNKVSGQMFVGTDANGNQVGGTADELAAAGATGITKLDADSGKKVITARQLVSPEGLFSLIRQDMDALDKKGKLGSAVTSRFNDALLKKAGSDPDYAPLFVHTHLLSTALMQAHVGSRGSSDMMGEFQKLADSGKMNASTLRSALGAEYNYVHEKAMLPKKVKQ